MIARFSPSQLLAALIVAAFTSAGLSFIIGAHPFVEAAIDWNGAARACGLVADSAETRAAVATLFVLVVVGLHFLPAIRCWRRSLGATREAAFLLEARRVPLDSRLQRIASELNLTPSVALVESDGRFAFTLGSRLPRIYISREAAEHLDDDELGAVLLHEKHHLQRRDAFAVRRIKALRAGIGYLPGVPWLTEAFLCSREYAADDSAVAATGQRSPLLRAFLKLQPIPSADRYAVGYMDYAVGRVNRLSGIADYHQADSEARGARALLVSFAVLTLPPLVTLCLTEPHLASVLPFG